MSKNFIQVCESNITRYTRGGFLVGDYIEFVKGFKEHEPYKKLAKNVQDLIDQMIDSGLHIRVVGINDTTPTRYPGNPDTDAGGVILNIALDNGGGRYTHYTVLPPCCAEPVNYYPNLAPLPDGVVRPNGEILKPVEFVADNTNKEQEDQNTKTDEGGKKKRKTDSKLATGYTKLKSSPNERESSPAVSDHTHEYLKGLAGY